MTSAATNPSSNNVRRYTSENNLNEINTSSKVVVLPQKLVRPIPLQTIATSTEDLTSIPAWKKLSPQARLSALLDKTNHPSAVSSLAVNGTSASLIDLTSIDKIPTNKQHIQQPPVARPRFRFVPPSDKNSVLKEEPELEQQSGQNYDHFDHKPLSPNRVIPTSKSTCCSSVGFIFHFSVVDGPTKPAVIHPPPTRSTNFTQPENNFHYQNGTSAFKPPPSHPTNHVKSPISPTNNVQRPNFPSQNHLPSNGNGVSYKTTQPPPVPNIKRTESTYKPGVHVGITNPNGLLARQHPNSAPQFHQSMLNLSSIGMTESVISTQPAVGMFGSRVSLQSTAPNFMKHPAYTPQSIKPNGNHQYSHPPQMNVPARPPPPPTLLEDPIIRWIQQVNNSSSITGLTSNGGGSRIAHQQQAPSQPPYPYAPYTNNSSALPPTNNGSDHPHRSQNYLNQINVHKHHSTQHTVPVQSAYLASPPISRNHHPSSTPANVYHFSQQVIEFFPEFN